MKTFSYALLFLTTPIMAQTVTHDSPPPAPPKPPAVIYRESVPVSFQKQKDFSPTTALYSIGAPTDQEQLYLELINRARANPNAEGLRLAASAHPNVVQAIAQFGVDLDLMKSEFAALPVRPPLAFNAQLMNAARAHSQFQFDSATQTHTGSGGSTLSDRLLAAGYGFLSGGENVFSYAQDVPHGHTSFQIDWGDDDPPDTDGMQDLRGHRLNIHGDFRETAVGIILGSNTVGPNTVGPQVVTQNFATSNTGTAFVTGVAYYDVNGNSFYDLGEGIGGLTVNVEGADFHAVTASSGGYAVPVPTANATRAVTFSGLNANGGGEAVISSGNNVKVDFTPLYVPSTLTGPNALGISLPSNFTFPHVPGTTGYKGRSISNVPVANDGADDVSRVTVVKTGSYSEISTTVKDAGTGSFHLLNPVPGVQTQTITYNAGFFVKTGASIAFRSRLGFATSDQVARVEVSTNGGIGWENLYTQAGTDGVGETAFQSRSLSLAAYVGKDIRLRFNYYFTSGDRFGQTSDGVGWYIDTVAFTNLVDFATATVTDLPAGTTFTYTPSALGEFYSPYPRSSQAETLASVRQRRCPSASAHLRVSMCLLHHSCV